jgi:hypothetical protein
MLRLLVISVIYQLKNRKNVANVLPFRGNRNTGIMEVARYYFICKVRCKY